MGWASGSGLLEEVARIVMPLIPKGKRKAVARELIEAFEAEDCDTIYEVEQRDIAAAYEGMHSPDDE